MNRRALFWGLGVFLALRLITSLAAGFSPEFMGTGTTVSVPGYEPPSTSGVGSVLGRPWLRADALWYLRIAEGGYGPETTTYAFYPLYPMAIRVASPLFGGNELYAALAISSLAAAGGLVLLFSLSERLAGTSAGEAAVLGLGLFPTAFFLVAPYAESLLVAFGSAALLATLDKRHTLAALLGVLAALSRPFGFLLFIPMIAIASETTRSAPSRWKGMVVATGPLGGFLGWVAWVWLRTGEPLFAMKVQSLWQRRATLPWDTIGRAFTAYGSWRKTELGPFFLLDILALGAGLSLVLLSAITLFRVRGRLASRAWIPWGLAGYGALLLIVPLAAMFPPRPLLSMPRFVLALFPCFLGLAILPLRARILIAAASAGGLTWLTAAFVAARPIF